MYGTLPALRERDLKSVLEGFADEASFDLKKCSRSNQELWLRVALRIDGLDQDEVVTVGGENWARRFRITVKYIETKIVEQVARFLQRMLVYLDEVQTVRIQVSTWSGEQLGEIKTTKAVMSELRGTHAEDISVARKRFELDTLGEKTMLVRIENRPIEI